ncbi:MAG: 50S ribosomal protein L28 [Candidatus Doudnabacteria bacterium]|nr:50S ribosomal protein L28 [Candidatus Doudnabacteria bacterium]
MRKCNICGKGYMNTVRRSHSMQANKVRLYPNLQWLKLPHGQRIKACTKCMKTYHRKMVVAAPAFAEASAGK